MKCLKSTLHVLCKCIKTIALLGFACMFCLRATSQTIIIDNASFQAGPFGQGSTIGVPISMSGCFKYKNTIRLYLCSPANTTGVLIGTFNQGGFFSTFINGSIPSGTPVRTDYYVEARTDFPVTKSNASTVFEVRNITAPTAFVNTTSANRRLIDSIFYGYCSGSPSTPRNVTLINQSTAGAVSTVQYKDENTGVVTNLPLTIGGTADVTLNVTYYTLLSKAEINGVISTWYLGLVNSTHNVGIGQSGEQKACLPDPLSIAVDITMSALGIKGNFPGSYYVFDYGDTGPNDTLTYCELMSLGGIVAHTYTQNSCGKTAIVGGQTIPNAYPIDIRYINPFKRSGNPNNCDEPVNAAFARIFRRPVADFLNPKKGCVNRQVKFTNTTVAGIAQNGNICTPAEDYEWYVNNTFAGNMRDLVYLFLAPGTYKIRLKVENASCAPSEKEDVICIEAEPVPDFKMNGQDALSGCADLALDITNQTTANACENKMKWIVYDDATGTVVDPKSGTYTITPNDSVTEPKFVFHKTGRLRVELQVSNTCGVFKRNKIVTVTGSGGLALPKDTGYCNTGLVIDFAANTAHKPNYFSNTGSETFLWTITGGAFSFENGTSATSAYPVIKFLDNAVYSVMAQITSPCGTGSATQRITFSLPISVDAGPPLIENCFSPTITVPLAGTVNGVVDSTKWITNGTGGFNTGNQLSAAYTLSAADKNNPNLYIVLRAYAPAGSACGILTDTIRIKTITSNTGRDTTVTVCSKGSLQFTPKSTVATSTFTYTGTVKSGAVNGVTATGSGAIIDVLINPGTTKAVIEYVITPYANGCDGTSFTLTVTVNPIPDMSPITTPAPICNGTSTGIQLSSSFAGVMYSWRSFVLVGNVTGNTSKTNQAVTAIDDKPLNKGNSNAKVIYHIAPVLGGCAGDTVEIIVEILPEGSQATAGLDQFLCEGVTQTHLKANAPAAGNGATGSWSLPAGYYATIVDPLQPETDVTGLQPGRYPFIWMLDNKICPPSIDTVWVTVLPAIVNTIDNVAKSICPKETVEIKGAPPSGGNGSFRSQWQESADGINFYDIAGETGMNFKANPDTNVYFRRMVYSLQCSMASNPVHITIKPVPVLTVTPDPLEVCPGSQITFTVSSTVSPFFYSYNSQVLLGNVTGNSSGISLSNPSFPESLKTNGIDSAIVAYEFVPSSDDCIGDMTTVTVKVLPGVTRANAGPDQKRCATTQVVLKGNVPERGTGKWLQVSGPPTTINDPLTATTVVTGLQAGISYIYAWEISASGLACGLSVDSMTVFVRRPTTIADAGADSTTCAPSIARLQLNGNLPAANEQGVWTIANTNMSPVPVLLSPRDEDCIITNLSTGYVTLRWTITSDADDCVPSSDVKTVIVGAITYVANAGADQVLCNVNSIQLQGNNVSGVPGFWSVAPGTVATIANPFNSAVTVTNVKAGTCRFVWTLDNGVCPAAWDTVIITIYDELENLLTDSSRIICYGQKIKLSGPPAKGGGGAYLYQWQQSIDGVLFSDLQGETGPELQITPQTTTWYRRVVYSPPCSKNSQAILITVRDPITNNIIGNDQTICINTTAAELTGSIPVGGSGSYLFQWESSLDTRTWTAIGGEIFATLKPGKLTQTTWYRRMVKSSLCPDIAAIASNVVLIKVNPDAKAEFSYYSGCAPLIINASTLNAQLYPDRNIGWIWLRDGLVKSNGPIYPSDTLKKLIDTTNITLIAISRYGCKNDTVTHGFATGAPPTVELGKGDSVMAGTVVHIHPEITNGPIKKFEWTPADLLKGDPSNPTVTINTEMLIGLKVTNPYCSASDTVRYKVFCDPDQLDVPTAFSPNHDGINDVLRVRGGGATNVCLKIFNRWGQIVFEKNNIRLNELADGWDGKTNGQVIQDVYTYTLTATCTAGLLFRKQGNILLKL